jgi:hypothetical protein
MADQLKGGNGWQEYQRLVLHELKAHTDSLAEFSKELNAVKIEIGMLKVKSGLWGLMGGFVPVALAVILKMVGE